MANDMNSAMNALKGILGDDAEEKIQAVMSSLSGGGDSGGNNNHTDAETTDGNLPAVSNNTGGGNSGINGDSLQYIMKMKGILDEMGNTNDSRSRLLLSLKPYMRAGRQKSIDNALRIMSFSKLTGFFK